MNLQCPTCHQPLTAENLNIKEGVGLCPACGNLTRLSELAGTQPMSSLMSALMEAGQSYEDTDISYQWRELPRGCEIHGWSGHVSLKASARSMGAGIGLLIFAVFWNSIVGVFVALVIASYLKHLFGISLGGFNDLPLFMTLFMTLFLTPFVMVGAFTISMVLVSFFGSVRLTVDGSIGRASTGIGPFRWTKTFDASQVMNVTLTRGIPNRHSNVKTAMATTANGRNMAILIEADRPVKFGSVLPDDRLKWLASAAAVVLMNPGSPDEITLLTLGDSGSRPL